MESDKKSHVVRDVGRFGGALRPAAAWLCVPALAGCAGVQSALDPAGPNAAAINFTGWIMIAGATAIFLFVMVLAAAAAFAPDRVRWLGRRGLVVGGGLAFPIVALSSLLAYEFSFGGHLTRGDGEPLRIAVVGERWWWRVRYLDENGGAQATSANEVHMPTGRPVEFVLTSPNVIHSFWIPSLGGKLDMIPGRENRFTLQADRTGTYRGVCAEYCGEQHALMAFSVVVHEPAEFDRWLARESEPAAEPADERLLRGRQAFIDWGCGACHAIQGTEAAGIIGPDLTHVGGRLTLGAGTLPNNASTLARWIARNQEIKPENLMPPFDMLPDEELTALAAYLESLK